MKEKILALLLAKFTGVRKDGLARLATALSLQAGDEAEAGELIEKLTAEKVNEFVTDYRKDVDKEVSDANKTYEGNLKKKYDLVEKANPDPNPNPNPNPTPDETPAWAKALIDQNKSLTDRLAAIETGKTTETRLQQLEGRIKNVPDTMKNKLLKDFRRMNFESEEAFAEYLGEVETDITAFNQELANKGLGEQTKPFFAAAGKSDEDAFVSMMQKVNAETKEN